MVFFKDGISQSLKTLNGQAFSSVMITDDKLKMLMNSVGINDSLIEIALPRFNIADTTITMSNGKTLEQPDMSKLYRIKVPNGKKRQDIVAFLNNLPEVLYAEPNGKITHQAIPSDTRFGEQWGLRNTVMPGADIHAVAAWDIYTGNSNNIIGIIDGGSLSTHVDLNDKISGGDAGYGWDGHGIHVSGIAAAESNNSQGISGVDWQARIHPQRIDNVSDDAATYQAIVDAVNYSPNVQVLNNSWTLIDENGNPGRYSTTVRQAFAYAYKANRTSVVSMGNHQLTNPGVVGYPAGFGNVIAVGATDNTDVIANFSCQGSHIDVCAPGVNILSTIDGGYGLMSGTSMAVPHVSGIASLLIGFNPNLANDDIENIIKLSADEVAGMNGQDFTNAYGFGRVNAERALNFLRTPNTVSQWSATSGSSVSSTGTFTMVFMGAPGLASSAYIVKRYEVRKTVTFPSQFLQIIGVWGRGVSTTGWNQANPNFGEGFCEVVPGTQTNTSATLRTYVYEVWSSSGSYLGYYPKSPSNVSFAYSVLGVPVPILSGPSVVCVSGSTFTVTNIPGVGTETVSWTCSPNLIFDNQTGNSKIFYASGTGTGYVTATFNSTIYGSITLPTSTVATGGPPSAVVTNSISNLLDMGYSNYYKILPASGSYAYEGTLTASAEGANSDSWSYVSGITGKNIAYWSASGNAVDVGAKTNNAGEVLRYTATNTCGSSSANYTFFTGNIGQPPPPPLIITPNPASTQAEVSIPDIDSNTDAQVAALPNTYTISIINSSGLSVYSTTDSQKKVIIPTSSLKNGIYNVRVSDGTSIFQGNLVVNH